MRRSKNVKKFAINEVSLKNPSKIIKEFKDVPYEGYVRKSYKPMTTDRYFYLTIQPASFMMSHLRGSARTQNLSMQNMSNS